MMTVNEVSKLTGVSIRTLQYYDKIGLLHPAKYTEAGYRLYNDAALETLQQILLFRELEFPLKDIKEIISRPDFDRSKALEQQIKLLTLKKEHIENLIDQEKSRGRTKEEDKKIYQGMIDIFGEFGQIRNTEPSSKDAQALVKKLQDYITEHMYTCTKKILSSLGKMYAGGGDFTKNIDSYGGEGTAEFTSQAIEIYCR